MLSIIRKVWNGNHNTLRPLTKGPMYLCVYLLQWCQLVFIRQPSVKGFVTTRKGYSVMITMHWQVFRLSILHLLIPSVMYGPVNFTDL